MTFSVEEGLFKLFPSLRVGVVVCEIDNIRYGEDGLEEVIDDLKVHFSFERPQDHPNIKAWREAYKKVGIPVTKYQSSIEALLRRALKGGPFPRFSPIVDLSNAISLKHLVPVGGHDINRIDGNIRLTYAEGTEKFVPMDLGEREIVEKGEVVYKDDKDVLTRRWVWRQSDKDRIESETTRVFISVDVMSGLQSWLCESVVKDLENSILVNDYGRIVHREILTRDKTETEFPF